MVYSEPGQGTTFKIYLPSAEHKIGLASKPEVETVSPKRQGTTILLVEDDEIMRGLTRKLLEEHGYTVVEADDGKSALEWVESHPGPIDLLLTDVVMRHMSGPELAERLAASRPNSESRLHVRLYRRTDGESRGVETRRDSAGEAFYPIRSVEYDPREVGVKSASDPKPRLPRPRALQPAVR